MYSSLSRLQSENINLTFLNGTKERGTILGPRMVVIPKVFAMSGHHEESSPMGGSEAPTRCKE
jgi:hypothetical protein